jgi:hypothetical protein
MVLLGYRRLAALAATAWISLVSLMAARPAGGAAWAFPPYRVAVRKTLKHPKHQNALIHH